VHPDPGRLVSRCLTGISVPPSRQLRSHSALGPIGEAASRRRLLALFAFRPSRGRTSTRAAVATRARASMHREISPKPTRSLGKPVIARRICFISPSACERPGNEHRSQTPTRCLCASSSRPIASLAHGPTVPIQCGTSSARTAAALARSVDRESFRKERSLPRGRLRGSNRHGLGSYSASPL